MQRDSFNLLKTRRFFPLFGTQFLEAFNDNFLKNALVILITYTLIHNARVAEIIVTAAGGIFILPFFLFSATAGQLADKYDKSFLIRVIKIVEIAAMILAAIGFIEKSTTLLLFTLFLMGTHSTFFGPIKYGILPDHLATEELNAGNALVEGSTFIAILFGTIFGGLFITIDSGSHLVASLGVLIAIAGLVFSFYIPKTTPAQPNLKISANIVEETKNIINFATAKKPVYLAILGLSWFWLIGAIMLAQITGFTKNSLGADAHVATLFLTIFSIGIAIGSILAMEVQKTRIDTRYIPLTILLMSVFFIDLFFASHTRVASSQLLGFWHFLGNFNHWRIILDLLFLAICGGFYIVPLYTILQTETENTHRARVIAANNIINSLFMAASAVVCGLLLAIGFSIPALFLLVGLINIPVALYFCKLLPDDFIKSLMASILKTFYRVKVEGLENYEQADERAVIVANHGSYLDVLLLSSFLPKRPLFAINADIAKKWYLQPFLSLVDIIPINPMDPMSTKRLIHIIQERQQHCIIFPEGRVNNSGALMKIYETPGLIADKAGAQILPIRIDGAQHTPFTRFKGKIRNRWFPEITLAVKPARKINITPEVKGRARRRQISAQFYDLMTDLIFESSPYQQTFFAALIEAAKTHGRKLKVVEDIERKPLNYKQFLMRCFILGRYMAQRSQAKENVGLLLPNAIATAVSFFGLHAFGRVPAMLNFSTGSKNVQLACKTAEVKTVYTSRKFVETAKIEDLVEKIAAINVNIIYLEDLRSQINLGHKLIGFLYSLFPTTVYRKFNPRISAQDPGVVLFTSGSEGVPKGVVHTHQSILANVYQMTARVDFTSRDIAFNPLPVFHCFGLTAGMVLPLVTGMKVFLYPSPLHYRIIPELIYDTSATMLFSTDTFLTGYARNSRAYDFYSIRYVFAGAEKLKDETRKIYAEKYGIALFEGYGATETAPVISTNTGMQNKNGTVGRFLPKMQYRLEPVTGIPEGGRLHVTGPNIMLGYLLASQPGQIQKPVDGWHDTGDIVSVDQQGYIHIQGRAKRFAKIGGEMISLTAVETYAAEIWPDQLHAAVNLPDAKKGEMIFLLTENPQAARDAFIQYAKKQGIAELYIPKKIIYVEKIPVLTTGKIDYVAVYEDAKLAMMENQSSD